MAMRRFFLLPGLLGLLAFVCSGASCAPEGEPQPDGDGGPNPPVNVAPQMDESVRTAAIQAANAKFESLLDRDLAAARQELVDYLESQPEFASAGIVESDVYANFVDGVTILFLNNHGSGPEVPGSKGILRDPGPIPTSMPAPIPPAMCGLTESRKQLGVPSAPLAYVASSLGAGYLLNNVGPLAGLLADHGYLQMSSGRASVLELQTSVNNAGVLYINAHGGVGEDIYGNPIFCVWTDTPDSPEDRAALYESEMKDSSLILATATYTRSPIPGQPYVATHFAFTQNFVRKHMTFAPDSLVYIDACWSQSTAAEPLKAAFFARCASVYAGWTTRVLDTTAAPATAFLFDRMLGSNNPGIYPEDPPQRPFDWGSTLNDMRQRSPRLDTDTYSDGLTPFLVLSWPNPDSNADNGLLAPSIGGVIVDAIHDKLQLKGRFGYNRTNEGSITVGGQSLDIESWKPDEIICTLPPDAFGDVTVFADPSRRSNTVQITKWELKLTSKATIKDPSAIGQIDLKIEVTLKLRACLNDFRDKPGNDPVKLQTVLAGVSRNSTGKVEASGQIVDPPNPMTGNGGTTTTAKTPAGQNWVVVQNLGDPAEADEDDYQIESVDYVQAGDLGRGLKMHIEVAGYWEYEQTTDQGTFCCSKRPTGFASNTYFDTGQPIQLPMDGNFTILAGKVNDLIDGTSTLEWANTAPQSPPDPNATR